jgi:hypothetical protein
LGFGIWKLEIGSWEFVLCPCSLRYNQRVNFLPLLLAVSLTTAPPPGDTLDELCVPRLQVEHPERCPDLGPGAYAAQLDAAHVPDSIPELPTVPLEKISPVVKFTYARLTTPDAPLFTSPEAALAGTIDRTLGRGFIFVNLTQTVQQGDQTFYQIRNGSYLRAGDVSQVKPTPFQGLAFSDNPAYPFGWMVATIRPSPKPGVKAPRKGPLLARRTVVQIFATMHVGDWDWYLIGPNQWVEQRAVGKVDLNPPPEGVTGKWIQVNLFEQTLAAYEDNRLIYATLVSSGLEKWPTRPGLFHIWSRLLIDRMRGSYEPDGSDYYYLEAVPWVMYFDGSRALHGEYWHDRLGFKRSHGCVNLAPLDARWLYNWTEQGTPVWVYDPSGQTPTDVEAGGAP